MSHRKLVAILMGGASSEREISLVSGRAVMEAIDTDRFDAVAIDVGTVGKLAVRTAASFATQSGSASIASDAPELSGPVRLFSELTQGRVPDIAFIALHGRYGEDGSIQGLLEIAGIPYTGSGVLASALAMDKTATKRIIRSCGIDTPAWITVSKSDFEAGRIPDATSVCGFPAIVKPNREGSTIGVTIVKSQNEVSDAIAEALKFDNSVLIEEFVEGIEITVGVLGNDDLQPLPIIEICPKSGFYDYEAKYTAGLTEKIVPARISEATAEIARQHALDTHRALGCSGMSRVDLIVSGGRVTVLEVNTIPGMTPTSLLPKAAHAAGISFTQLISRIIDYGFQEGVR